MITKRDINAILEFSKKEVNPEDLDELQEYYSNFIRWFINSSEKKVFNKLVLKEKAVIIGDLHCDYSSLAEIINKLLISEYDYFNKAYFVFLGDYLDRGQLPLETLKLLFELKKLLQERCIFLRGNHDDFKYNDSTQTFYSDVHPSETVELFNEYLKDITLFNFKDFFNHLPYFLIVETEKINYLIVHAGIPKDKFSKNFNLEKLSNFVLPLDKSDSSPEMHKTLLSMLWGDPSDVDFKNNDSTSRFEFGREQFFNFMKKNNFDCLIRGHETAEYGISRKYDDRLITVFSSGSMPNQNSYYNETVPYPAFAVLEPQGLLKPETIFVYKLQTFLNDTKSDFSKVAGYFKSNDLKSFIVETDLPIDVNYDEIIEQIPINNLYLEDEFAIRISYDYNLDFNKIPQNFDSYQKSFRKFLTDLTTKKH